MALQRVPKNIQEAEHLLREIHENYDILRGHTKLGFWFAILFMGLGLVVILTGAFAGLFGWTFASNDLAATSGIVLEAVAGTAIWIYWTNSKKLSQASAQIDSILRILIAFREIEQLPDYERSKERIKLIAKLTEQC